MTTVELRTSIAADLDQMSIEMLESVSHYVKRLRRHARLVRRTAVKNSATAEAAVSRKTIGITPGVARLCTGQSRHISDEELDRLRYEYLIEKYQ